ncbi:molybdate ABC transporter permease subunit [Cocleimonas sp. KMM 6892]|uniref:molybdate ABC transporter permease subunit n=1 Tax=unclassified Cocleimonas TaxID=2639732 RepID=UPI002DB614F3|nr:MULTISPECIES: molybdate ABC transporter permease subunit [unclassified Cocleimonas]MEB8432627.1 molybdate ABC transporter permease subunit [Cocleimonas sp. KMM 6892]MEC4715486.1 molybdate ABC transporter permease subunit [Cocleimonas sp. KMM 6895]MEC4744896.1 molybdate ABC transporter permease subunit [Cocleimonas sp. KMM 6896]
MTLSDADLTALIITLKLACTTTAILLLLGTPLAWWLARTRWRFKFLIEAMVALPLVLPPTVLGFYLLITLGPHGAIGGLMDWLGMKPLAFTFSGLVIGSVIYSLPFVVQPLQGAFASIGTRSLEVASTLRASPIDRFFTVEIPLARSGFLTAAVLGFAHTVGEFGVVLMIGGNIPGQTQVVSIAIYDHVEVLEYSQAHWLSGGLLLASFLMLMIVYALNRRFLVAQP